MLNQPPIAAPIPNTNVGPFFYLRGGFELGSTSVPYFSTTMTVKQAASLVHLPSELPVSTERHVELDDLFQRDLNEERVRSELIPYLKGQQRIRFFNSITVAILPLEKTGTHLEIADSYGDYVRPTQVFPGYDICSVGQVSVLENPNDTTHGYLLWDSTLAFPVVLDGQHRLAALKAAISMPDFPDRHYLEEARVSILFLVLDSRVGFRAPGGQSVLSACRSIFTDLNKFARGISKSRQYLLDDKDLNAVCLRSILEPGVSGAPQGGVESRAVDAKQLPLALIDWRGDSARFDGASPFLSSVISLHSVVSALVDKRPPDGDEHEEYSRYVDQVSARLLPAEQVSEFVEPIKQRIADLQERAVPFELSESEILTLAQGFRAKFGSRVVEPLVRAKPYRSLIQSLSTAGYLGTAFEPWFSLDNLGRERLLESLEMSDPTAAIEKLSREAKDGNLAFQVVFQQALLLSLHTLLSFESELCRYWGISERSPIDSWVERWDDRVSGHLAKGASTDSAFHGAGIRPDGSSIDFRKTRVATITAVMTFGVLSPDDWWTNAAPPPPSEVVAWLADVTSGAESGLEAGLKAVVSRSWTAWRRGLSEVISARGDSVSDDVLLNEAGAKLFRMVTSR